MGTLAGLGAASLVVGGVGGFMAGKGLGEKDAEKEKDELEAQKNDEIMMELEKEH